MDDLKKMKSIHRNILYKESKKFTYPIEMQKYEKLNFALIVVKMCSNEPKGTTQAILIRMYRLADSTL